MRKRCFQPRGQHHKLRAGNQRVYPWQSEERTVWRAHVWLFLPPAFPACLCLHFSPLLFTELLASPPRGKGGGGHLLLCIKEVCSAPLEEPLTERLHFRSGGYSFVSLWQAQHTHTSGQSCVFASKRNEWQWKGQRRATLGRSPSAQGSSRRSISGKCWQCCALLSRRISPPVLALTGMRIIQNSDQGKGMH